MLYAVFMFFKDPLEGNVEFVPYIEVVFFVAIRADGKGLLPLPRAVIPL